MRRSGGRNALLAGTAGLIAVSGAQAADLPAKAKPVEYVRICTMYGDGFYYIPGSDTCIKIGGYIRADYGFNTAGGRNPAYGGTQGAQDRTVAQYSTRHRGNLAIDTRTQTEYGTLRTMTSIHIQNQDQTESENISRAFIQWAGFTIGHSKSFSDTWSIESDWHYATQQNQSDTGANGVNQVSYTYEIGNGIALNFGADERRSKNISNLSRSDAIKVGAEPANSSTGQRWPDPYVSLYINQEWGFWRASVLAHDVSATNFTDTGATGTCPNPGGNGPTGVALTSCGHPGDRIGWVVMEGGEFKLPALGPGDRVGYFFHYGKGTSAYSGGSVLTSAGLFGSGNQVAVGWLTDGIYANGSRLELTTTWTAAAGYEHFWTPTISTSVFGAYTNVSYDSAAKGLFATDVCPTVARGGQVGFNSVSTNCDPDWRYLQAGARLQWLPVPGFRMGVEAVYTRVYTAFNGATANLAGTNTSGTTGVVTPVNPVIGARPSGVYNISDQNTWALVFRMQRNFNNASLQ